MPNQRDYLQHERDKMADEKQITIFHDSDHDEWVVELIDMGDEGQCTKVKFGGSNAQQMAIEFVNLHDQFTQQCGEYGSLIFRAANARIAELEAENAKLVQVNADVLRDWHYGQIENGKLLAENARLRGVQ